MFRVDMKVVAECCSPLLAAPLAVADAESLAESFKVLADPVRLRLLSLIAATGEVCACDLVAPLDRSPPTVSHHLKVLREAGLLTAERRGSWSYHRVVPERLGVLRDALAAPGR